MLEQLEPPRKLYNVWYVACLYNANLFLHDDGYIHIGIIKTDSTGWYDTEQDAWDARSGYYRLVGIPDTVLIVASDDTVRSMPLFDD